MSKSVRRLPPLSVRLSETERATLTRRANGVGLSTYVKSVLFAGRRTAPADRAALAQLLGQLGASGIASSLRMLADATETGSLVADETTTAQLREAVGAVVAMHDMLRAALSGRLVQPSPLPAPTSDLSSLFNDLNRAWEDRE